MALDWFKNLGGAHERESGGLTNAQRFVLAMGGILRELNDDHHDLLAGRARGAGAGGAILASWWEIRNREELLEALGNMLGTHTNDEGEVVLQDNPAWDWLRASNVAQWGYDMRLLDANEAWRVMCQAAERVQSVFDSFSRIGDDYLTGYLIANDLDQFGPSDPVQIAVKALLLPGGVWSQLDWATPLANVPAPVDAPEFLVARPGEPIADVLRRVDERGIDRSRTLVQIELSPGLYPLGDVVIEGSVELLATGPGVVFVVPDDQSGFVLDDVNSGLRLKGIEIRGAEDSMLFSVAQGYLLLEDCTLKGPGYGVVVQSGNANARIVNCTFEDLTVGVDGQLGHTDIASSLFKGVALQAAKVQSDATLYVDDCRIETSIGRGIQVGGQAKVSKTRFERLAQTTVEVLPGGALVLEQCGFFDCQYIGLHVHPQAADIVVLETDFRRTGAYAAQIQSHTIFKKCRFEDSRSVEVVVWQTPADFVDCVFQGSALASAYVTGQNLEPSHRRMVKFARCLIRDARTDGLLVLEGGVASLSQVEVVDCAGSAVEVRAKGVLFAENSVWRGKGTRALHVHGGGASMLRACKLSAVADEVVLIDAGKVRLEACEVTGAPTGIWLANEAELEMLDTTIIQATESAGLVVTNRSRARIQGGKLLNNRKVNASIQNHSLASFIDVTFEGSDVHVVESGAARFDRAVLRESDETGILVDDGYAAFVSGEVSDARLSGVEARDGGKAILVGTTIDQSGGEAAVYAHDECEVLVVQGTLGGGSSALVEATRNGRILLSQTKLLAQDGVEVDASSPLLLAHDGGVIGEASHEALTAFQSGTTWTALFELAARELVRIEVSDEDFDDEDIEGDFDDEEIEGDFDDEDSDDDFDDGGDSDD